jgi:hypothetical protein
VENQALRAANSLEWPAADLLSRKWLPNCHSEERPMDATLPLQLSIAALVCSIAALFFSLLAAFPGLKDVLTAVRDGVLWFALFLVLGGVTFVAWKHFHKPPPASITAGNSLNHAGRAAGH